MKDQKIDLPIKYKLPRYYLGTDGDCNSETHSQFYFYEGQLVRFHWGAYYLTSPKEELKTINEKLEALQPYLKDEYYTERIWNIKSLKANIIERFGLNESNCK